MKIESISAYSRSGDTQVTVSLAVPGDAETALATIFDLVRSASVSRDTELTSEIPEALAAEIKTLINETNAVLETMEFAEEAAPAAAEPAPEATPSPRRRRAAATGQSEAHPTQEGTTTATEATTASEPAPAPTRRRRETPTTAPTAEPPASSDAPATSTASDISDADLLKAASQAAMKITPKGVMEFLATFGAKQVNDLKGEHRRQFIDGLKTRTA